MKNLKLLGIILISVMMIMTLVLTACKTQDTDTAEKVDESIAEAEEENMEITEEAEVEEDDEMDSEPLESGVIADVEVTKENVKYFVPLVIDDTDEVQPINPDNLGPNGNSPVGIEEIEALLTDDVIEKVINNNFTAAITLHTEAADWSQLQLRAIKSVLEKYNIELVAQTDAEWKVEKQIADLESIIELKPDLIVGFTIDRDSLEPTYRKASEAGILISFIDSIPTGFQHPQDYAGLSLADNYECGVGAAELLHEAIGDEGQITIIDINVSMFHVEQRYRGIRDYFENVPGIEIVDVQKVGTPEEAATVTENWLIAYPDLKGIATVWDGFGNPAAGVIDNLGADVKVTAVDLSDDSAYSIVAGGALIGVTAQHPYDQGIAEALLGIAALGGVETPPYVLVPTEKVTAESMTRSYYRVFRREMPEELVEAMKTAGLID